MDGNQLDTLRTALLNAHKALIEDAKRVYMEAGNPEPTPVEFWHLLIQAPPFQWLRRVSETIVAMDEALEKGMMTETQAFTLVKEELIDDVGPEFSDKLRRACARDPHCEGAWQRVVMLVA